MSSWQSPQSIFNLGHRAVKELFSVPVQIQEKVDGSFFGFGVYPSEDQPGYKLSEDDRDMLKRMRISQNLPGELELRVRSKGAVMIVDAPESLFKPAVAAVKARQHLLKPGWMYRGETLAKAKHNALAYDRVPKDNVILFDVLTDQETYLSYEELVKEAERIGFEVVPQLYAGNIQSAEELRKFLDTTSVLGGQKIEGVVVKPLTPMYGPDKKMLFAKFVSEAFKEVHRKAWGESNPGPRDIITQLAEAYGTQARWQKALIHLKEAGQIENAPKDIGLLIREIPADVLKECEDEIKQALFKYAWPHISRGITKGVAQWYKDLLLRQQFEEDSKDS